MVRKLSVFGIAAPVLYVLHVVLGGLLWKGYSHITQPISDLTASGAPNRNVLVPITNLYGLCTLIFSICVLVYVWKLKHRAINVGAILFVLMSLTTLSYALFPQDMPGTSLTFKGLMHLVVTGLIVPTAIFSPLLIGLGFRKFKDIKWFTLYSIVTAIVIFISGGLSVIFIANKIAYFGVVERINIGALELWIFIFAVLLYKSDILKIDAKDGISV